MQKKVEEKKKEMERKTDSVGLVGGGAEQKAGVSCESVESSAAATPRNVRYTATYAVTHVG